MTDAKKRILSELEYFSRKLEQYQSRKRLEPHRRSVEFFIETFEGYRKDAEQRLAIEEANASGELIDFSFIGQRADRGAMPLDHFLKVMTPLNAALNKAAYRLRTGVEARRITDEIKDVLNLKLAGLAVGSTRVLVTGANLTDMTGQNVLQNTLTQTFRLLNADSEDFYDAVDAVGGSSAKKIGEALETTLRLGMSARFTWSRQADPLVWHGSPHEIERVIGLIDSTQTHETFEQTLSGVVASVADSGVIYIRSGDEKLKIRFPMKAIEDVQRLHVMQQVTLLVNTSKYFDTVLKKNVLKHTLVRVQD